MLEILKAFGQIFWAMITIKIQIQNLNIPLLAILGLPGTIWAAYQIGRKILHALESR